MQVPPDVRLGVKVTRTAAPRNECSRRRPAQRARNGPLLGRIRGRIGDRQRGDASPESAVRKEGVEPSRELPHRNLNGSKSSASTRKHARSLRQKASANASERQDSGRTDPNLREEVAGLLDEALRHWTAEI